MKDMCCIADVQMILKSEIVPRQKCYGGGGAFVDKVPIVSEARKF